MVKSTTIDYSKVSDCKGVYSLTVAFLVGKFLDKNSLN
jgi:hypothetical protein